VSRYWKGLVKNKKKTLKPIKKNPSDHGDDREPDGSPALDSDGGERRSVKSVILRVELHRSLLSPLQRTPQVLLQARLLPRPLRNRFFSLSLSLTQHNFLLLICLLANGSGSHLLVCLLIIKLMDQN